MIDTDSNTFLTELGNRISGRRRALQMTQEALAEAVGLSVQSISCLELGKKRVRPENLSKLAAALSVSADYLLTGKKDRQQLSDIEQKLALLSPEDYKIVEALIDHLNQRHL